MSKRDKRITTWDLQLTHNLHNLARYLPELDASIQRRMFGECKDAPDAMEFFEWEVLKNFGVKNYPASRIVSLTNLRIARDMYEEYPHLVMCKTPPESLDPFVAKYPIRPLKERALLRVVVCIRDLLWKLRHEGGEHA